MEALHEVGFMYIRNAGMSEVMYKRLFATMAQFFAQTTEYKESLAWTTSAANRGYVGAGRQGTRPKPSGGSQGGIRYGMGSGRNRGTTSA